MTTYQNKILVALDGSERSEKTIQYLCNFIPLRDTELILFSIVPKVPDHYYDLKSEPFAHDTVSTVAAWESGCRKQMEDSLEEARNRLVAWGHRPENVQIHIAPRNKGVARDLLEEAGKGYHALIIRRRGWANSGLGLVLGSVSTKILENAVDIPLILAGVQEVGHSVFIALDGSEGAWKALEFTSKTIHGTGCRITLGTAVRTSDRYDPQWSHTFKTNSLDQVRSQSADARAYLLDSGIKENAITESLMMDAPSRAAAIVETARTQGCDTIVVGRKGISEVPGFSMGRIPWKVINGAKEMTVWIVPNT